MTRNIEALQQLRRVVADAPEHLFHMRQVTEEANCGTAHCALGWAHVDPWFQQRQLAPPRSESFAAAEVRAAQFFGLSKKQVTLLFAGQIPVFGRDPHPVTKVEVLWNIDELIEGREPLPYRAIVHESRKHYANYCGPCAAGL